MGGAHCGEGKEKATTASTYQNCISVFKYFNVQCKPIHYIKADQCSRLYSGPSINHCAAEMSFVESETTEVEF